MKKLFTLALALSVAAGGFAQVKSMSSKDVKSAQKYVAPRLEASYENVQSQPNMTRTAGELDFTTYDWQTNQGALTRTINWPDGKVSFAFTYASDANYSDRGTAVGTYDPVADEWIPSGGRVESERTGFGSIARYRDNGIVVAAHTSSNLGVYIVEDKDNIVPNSAAAVLYTGSSSYTHPAVMTSGANRDIIHVFAGNFEDSSIPAKYWRSSDGQNWDMTEVILPYLEESGSDWGTNEYYWMETTDDNCLALVINSAWSDGMVLYSYDNGETWEKKVFYHHPGVNTDFGDPQAGGSVFLYPRWTSAQWNSNKELMLAYEFNGSTGAPGSGSYYPGIGGVAFWSEYMPYRSTVEPAFGFDPTNPMAPVQGQPFIMDSAYIWQDIYGSWPLFSDQTHDMLPEYMGYLPALTDEGEWESWEVAENYNIDSDGRDKHGKYNNGPVSFPVLCKVNNSDSDLVAVWAALDENNTDEVGNYFFKIFASMSEDGGLTWSDMKHLTNSFEYTYLENVYLQAAVTNNTLVVVSQADYQTGTFVQSDETEGEDCYYQGFTFDLTETFGYDAVGEQVSNNTHMSIYPNPAVDQLNVSLNQSASIVVYNSIGQVIRTQEGRVGANTVDLSGLNAGIYFISAGSDTQKFIVK